MGGGKQLKFEPFEKGEFGGDAWEKWVTIIDGFVEVRRLTGCINVFCTWGLCSEGFRDLESSLGKNLGLEKLLV